MSISLGLYHRSPYFLRQIIASARGYYLRAWRYGPDHETAVERALERETWSADQWTAWREERLSRLLHRAASQVPYYRNLWAERRRYHDRASWEYLENWPLLEKEAVRQHPVKFVAEDCDIRRMFHEHTSGTTGKSLDLWWSRATVREWYAITEARCRRWHGVSREDRWAILGGQLVTPIYQRHPPFWVWNAALKQLYMSSYHLAPDWIPAYLDALIRYRVRYLWGYTSSLYALAQEAIRLGRKDLRMEVVITNAEPVFDYQRAAIEAAFQCPLRETYGLAEIVAAASECPSGALHLWPEVGVVEILDSDPNQSAGTCGELVCTGLLNSDMPLIRYKTGDRGCLPKESPLCACGRSLPLIQSIEGRVDDILYTPDRRRIGRLDTAFKAHLPIREAQIIQEALDCVRIRYVPAEGYSPSAGRSMVERIQARMGPIEVILEETSEIPREKNGKFRAVICRLSDEEKQSLMR